MKWVGIIILMAFVACAWANYRWHQGFTMGADTVMCVEYSQLDGWKSAMKTDACQNIKDRKPPFMPGWARPQGPPAEISSPANG